MPVPPRPNILFLFSDQQRWDTVGCYGRPIVDNLTPNLDRLASEGTLFKHAFTCQPVCGPARACLQTGLYATQTGCFCNNIRLKPEQPTLARGLAACGYETAYVGKWHLASNREHNYQKRAVPQELRGGYQDYWMASDVLEFTSHGYEGYLHDGENRRIDWEGYRVDRITDFALDYLRGYHARGSSKPFFMFASYIEPHHQNDLDRYVGPMGSKERFAGYRVPPDLLLADTEKSDWRQQMPDYLGCCWSLDQNVGRIVAELQRLGLEENTLIIYTSDHGSHFRTRNIEYKRACHESCLRVPLIVRGPGFNTGRTVEELVSLIDLPATIVTAANVSLLPNMQGNPLQKLTSGAGADWPQEIFVQISEDHMGRALRTKRWKYEVTVPNDKPWSGGTQAFSDRYTETCLYDLENDPHEVNNLVRDPSLSAIRSQLATSLKSWMARAGEPPVIIAPAP